MVFMMLTIFYQGSQIQMPVEDSAIKLLIEGGHVQGNKY